MVSAGLKILRLIDNEQPDFVAGLERIVCRLVMVVAIWIGTNSGSGFGSGVGEGSSVFVQDARTASVMRINASFFIALFK